MRLHFSLVQRIVFSLMVCFTLILSFSSKSFADELIFKCRNNICSAESPAPNTDEIQKLATSVYKLMDFNTAQTNKCITNGGNASGGAKCTLGTGADAYNLNCNFKTLSNGHNKAVCKLDNPKFENVMSMECVKSPNCKQCVYKLDKSPIFQEMANTGNFGKLSINESAINNAFWSCLNRQTSSAGLQAQCDKLLNDLMDPVQGAEVANKLITLFENLTPKSADSAMDISAFSSNTSGQNVSSRLSQVRSGNVANNVQLHYFDGHQWLAANSLLADNTETMNDVSPTPIADSSSASIGDLNRFGLFVNGSIVDSKQAATGIEQGSDAGTKTLTLGGDYRFTDQWIGGAALNLSNTGVDFGGKTGEMDADNTAIMLYGSYYRNAWYMDANVSLSMDKYAQKRNVDCSACALVFFQTFKTDFDGSQQSLSVDGGYQWQYESWGINPFAQITQAKIKTDAFAEKASSVGTGDNFALAIGKQNRNATTLRIGSNVQYIHNTSRGVVMPMFSLHLINELAQSANAVNGHFIGNSSGNSGFNLATNDVDKTYFILGGGVNMQLKNGNACFVNLQSTQGYDNLDQIQYTAGWRWEI